jgi:hypothetical protein
VPLVESMVAIVLADQLLQVGFSNGCLGRCGCFVVMQLVKWSACVLVLSPALCLWWRAWWLLYWLTSCCRQGSAMVALGEEGAFWLSVHAADDLIYMWCCC